MTGQGWLAIWTLVVSLVATGVGSFIAIIVRRRTDRLKGQLDRVDTQLRDFYGPLLAAAEASEQAWNVFTRRYNPSAVPPRNFWDPAHPPSPEARVAYRHWVTAVFMPLNQQMVEIISAHADLLIERGMPQCLATLCGHSLSLQAVLSSWDVTAGGAPDVPEYPAQALLAYLEDSFGALKAEQVRLLKAVASNRGYPLTENSSQVQLISDRWEAPTPGAP